MEMESNLPVSSSALMWYIRVARRALMDMSSQSGSSRPPSSIGP